jgi:peptide deformylase
MGDMPIEQLTRLGQVRAIVRWGTPVLHAPSRPVTDFGPGLQELLGDLFATNTAARGAGLAAPQIGVDLAVFVYDCVDDVLHRQVGLVCNPRVELPEGPRRRLETWDEGCLSLPGGYAALARPDTATVVGQDQYGQNVRVTGTGQLARCFQHETDHLRGVVFGDRLSSRRRKELYANHRRLADRYPEDWPVAPDATS